MKITADMIETAASDVGGDYRSDYPGRGMFGDTCPAVVADIACKASIVRSIAGQIADIEEEDGYEVTRDDAFELEADIESRISSDAMGLGVVYYFRTVKN